MVDLALLETAVNDLLSKFEVTEPPVPIELILQRPQPAMWLAVDLNELSGTFLKVGHRYSPRMSLARLLARTASRSLWGKDMGIGPVIEDKPSIYAFARAILLPRVMLDVMPHGSRSLSNVGERFEVPEDDVRLRLIEIGYMLGEA